MMIKSFLWVALGLLLIASIVRERRLRSSIGALGWMFFAIHWGMLMQYFIGADIFNAVLAALVSILCIFIAFFNIQAYHGGKLSREVDVLHTITFIAAVGGISYFPFAEIPILNTFLIDIVTAHTVFWLNFLGFPAVQYMTYFIVIAPNIRPLVRIVLACTGIESMALFAGITLVVGKSIGRKFKAFMISVPVIYALNIFRNMFIIVAYHGQWFGVDSFFIAHDVISKIGSTIAVVLIAYAVIRILPELMDVITGVAQMFKDIRGVG